jgi:hypothetical protein
MDTRVHALSQDNASTKAATDHWRECCCRLRGMIEDAEAGCRRALPVDAPYDEADIERRMQEGPPQSAEDYLLRVRCGTHVTTREHVPRPSLSPCPPPVTPRGTWRDGSLQCMLSSACVGTAVGWLSVQVRGSSHPGCDRVQERERSTVRPPAGVCSRHSTAALLDGLLCCHRRDLRAAVGRLCGGYCRRRTCHR